jgi:hypothetical protein
MDVYTAEKKIAWTSRALFGLSFGTNFKKLILVRMTLANKVVPKTVYDLTKLRNYGGFWMSQNMIK